MERREEEGREGGRERQVGDRGGGGREGSRERREGGRSREGTE